MAVFAGSLNETAFVERAIAHYAGFLAGDPASQGQRTQEMEWLQAQIRDLKHDQQGAQHVAQYAAEKATDQAQEIERLQAQIRDLERDLRQAQAMLHQAASTKRIQATKKPRHAEPTISIDSLKPDGTMRNYVLRWEQDGLLTIAELESIDERSSARGYRLYSSCHSIARPGQPLGERQQDQGATMIKAARTRMVEELLKAGWKPSDPANAEASVTVWKYQGGNEKR